MTGEPDVPGLRALTVSVASLLASRGGAGCDVDHAAGTWSDDLAGMGCLTARRHVRPAPAGGLMLDTREQSWTLPGDAGFEAGTATPGVAVEREAADEILSLRQWVLRPGAELTVGSGCAPGGDRPCPVDRKVKGNLTGRVHRDDPKTKSREGFAGFPGFGAGGAPGAGWDTREGAAAICIADGPRAARGGAQPVGAAPLLLSGPLAGLAAGVPYAVSIVTCASHDDADVPLLRAALGDGAVDVREDEVAQPASPAWHAMTPATFTVTPTGATGDWRLRVTSAPGAHAHCLLLGPAYVTAQRGAWTSPVLDTFSDATAWRDVEWELDQASAAADPACGCRSPGSPLAPVRLWWEAAGAPPAAPRYAIAAPAPDRGTAVIPAAVTGRYFRFGVALHGRETAGEVAPDLAPRDARLHFAGWRPVVKRLRVRYRAVAGRAESPLIAPIGVDGWTSVAWDGGAPGASAVAVDVLAADGAVLVADAGKAGDLTGIDPFLHPALRLRARVTADPADPEAVAVLRRWSVRWRPLRGRVRLEVPSIRAGDRVRGLVAVERAGRVRIRVHDAGGAVVATVMDEHRPAGTTVFAWDGLDKRGEPVRPATYRITATSPGGAGTRPVTVTR